MLTVALLLVVKDGTLLAKGFLLSTLNNNDNGFNSIAVRIGSSLFGSFDNSLKKVFKFSLM